MWSVLRLVGQLGVFIDILYTYIYIHKQNHLFFLVVHRRCWEVSFARVQGREQNMENLRDEKFIEKLMDRQLN